VLHLVGFDHEDDHSAEAMEQLEIQVMKRLGLPDPYQLDRNLIDKTNPANMADNQRF
jgi:Predicted metal-dependent hydrolase